LKALRNPQPSWGFSLYKNIRDQVVEAIETYFEGEVDLVIYSIASGMRRKGDSKEFWHSVIKPIGDSVTGATVLLENDQWLDTTLAPASEQEIADTLKVMGGEDWENWIDTLINHDSLAQGCKTIAFSYVGSELTHPIYLDGTLGRAKVDLHQTSHALNLKLANYDGNAYAAVCKALVTKASVFIPAFTPYMLALYRVMKQKGTHEGCIEQMQRLFSDKLYTGKPVPVDSERLVRVDEWELAPDTQAQVQDLVHQMNGSNFTELGDYQGFKQEFLRLNGFGFPEIDHQQDVDLSPFMDHI
ncbi:bifunctional NADH-specific enoyl-ACP reductase/trans-2-enoyl-CoA reductase, partial [Vibrio metschnikovii]|uniref:bifunctional NADH-specific enoyl-ACP reductase/trans-2-enoyl-CoA reductase n=1 Tax=Vibrio metschnikovii TaxID=28172 RepID=UPI002FCBFBDF